MKKTLSVLLALVMTICMLTTTAMVASAAETDTQSGIEATLVTDKDAYSSGEDIKVTVNVKNTNTYDVNDVSITVELPEGLTLKSGDLSISGVDIAAGEIYSKEVVAIKGASTPPTDTPTDTPTDKPSTGNHNTGNNGNGNANNPQTGDSSNIVLWVALMAISAAGIFLTVKFRKMSKKFLSLFLCVAMVCAIVPTGAFAAEGDTSTVNITVDKTITVDGNECTIKASVMINEINRSEFIVKFNTNGGNFIEDQIVKKGDMVSIPEHPEKEGFAFVGWYTDTDFSKLFDFNVSINDSCTLFARWVNVTDTTDTDDDGLPDEIEKYFGTDIFSTDTDRDGLNDYVEIVILNSNPLSNDTDSDGILDGQEDFDNDGIDNKTEIEIGTDPSIIDTDGDSLTDKLEIDTYRTNPITDDTDSDGANDGWEINSGFDPLTFDQSFNVEIRSEETIKDSGVAASVSIDATGSQVSSLKIKAISQNEEPLLSESIPGYLGNAYDFSIDGNIASATITFEYDTSLGAISEEFQPAIYYFNEEKGVFEEIENQTVTNGMVSAVVSHFSKYILLNKVEFDKVWENEIKPPLSGGDSENEATLDIVFVIDYSASMDDNDHYQLFKSLSEEFVNKLRDGKDKAGAVKFIRRATLVSELTTNKESVIASINGINYDDGYRTYSGTDGSTGIKMALDELAKSDSKYQYIVFITDGEDNGYTYSYDSLIATANESSVTIYAVGMGSASESILKKVSGQTGGKYYHATTGVSVDDLIDLNDVFDDIESETVDLTTDSNNDKIPDYYNDLIKTGILRLSNGSDEFAGIDFNFNKDGKQGNDYDGDGIINGDELCLVQSGNVVYLKMKSNPAVKDTDHDGLIDSTDDVPLKWDVSDRDLAIFAALAYDTPEKYNSKSIDDNYHFSNYASANEVYDYWDIVDCSGEKWADIATHFYATTYKNGNNIVISYRGTDGEWGEWANNILGVGLLNYHSEEGYATNYAKKIADLYTNCNIYITGHSLGGYLAQFGASEIILHHNKNNLKKVAYFNGIGLKYNPVLSFMKDGVTDSLKNYYNGDQNNPNLISYNIYGDVVSALGKHSGAIIGYPATSDAIAHHKGKYGSGGLKDFLSKSAAVWFSVLSSENIAYYYNYYDCSSIKEYLNITHETNSFYYYLTAGTRNYN